MSIATERKLPGLLATTMQALGLVSAGGTWTLTDPGIWGHALGGGRKTVSAEYVSEDSALNYSAVWCATNLYCGIGGSLPLPIYTGLEDEKREKARKHPLYRLLNRSMNPEMTAFQGRSVLWQWQVNWGNAYAEIEREGNTPDAPLKALWPIHPSRVRIVREDSGDLYYEVRNEKGGGTVDVDPWRMWHLPSIVTKDGIEGEGVVSRARETIGAGLAKEKKGAHFFGSGAMPTVIVEHTGKFDDTQRKAFRQEWHEIHDGADGENVALLGGGATAKPLPFDADKLQFIEGRQFDIEEIARWYNLPPHMLKHLLRATFSNIEHLWIEFAQTALCPWLKTWEQSINHKLLTPAEQEDYFAEHNVDALLRGDSAARAAYYHQGINDGWLNRNEARKLENLDQVDGGDTFLVQGAMVPLGDDGKPPAAEKPPAPGPATSQPADDAETIRASMRVTATRLLKRDLIRMLTKETKAVTEIARQSTVGDRRAHDPFAKRVTDFYLKHAAQLCDAIAEPLDALVTLGVDAKPDVLSHAWCKSAEETIVTRCASATTKDELTAAVASLVESQAWTERPERTIEGIAA